MQVRFVATAFARRHLSQLYPIGLQIFRAQLYSYLKDRDYAQRYTARYFLPLQLSSLNNDSFGEAWTGIHLRSRGKDHECETVLVDLVIEGKEWSYDDSQITLSHVVPASLEQKIDKDPIKALGLPDFLRPMNVFRNGEGQTVVRITQDADTFEVSQVSSVKVSPKAQSIPLPAPMGERLGSISNALGEQRSPFENSISAYHAMMQWYAQSDRAWRLEEFIISREWMIGARGRENNQIIDVKRIGGSETPELTPAEQTMLELEEQTKG